MVLLYFATTGFTHGFLNYLWLTAEEEGGEVRIQVDRTNTTMNISCGDKELSVSWEKIQKTMKSGSTFCIKPGINADSNKSFPSLAGDVGILIAMF